MCSAHFKEYELCLHRKPAGKGGKTLSGRAPAWHTQELALVSSTSQPPSTTQTHEHAFTCTLTLIHRQKSAESWGSIIARPNHAATRTPLLCDVTDKL